MTVPRVSPDIRPLRIGNASGLGGCSGQKHEITAPAAAIVRCSSAWAAG